MGKLNNSASFIDSGRSLMKRVGKVGPRMEPLGIRNGHRFDSTDDC